MLLHRNSRASALVALGLLAGSAGLTAAVTESGRDWSVHYNLPDQDTSFKSSRNADEWAIRQALLRRIRALRRGNEAILATYRWSGSSHACGAAGPILNAVADALDRGAKVTFIAARDVDTKTVLGGSHSLSSLASRKRNPLVLVQDRSPQGIMHHKLGLFEYARNDRWVLVTSWNFTGGASSLQWNIALEMRSNPLYAAYALEMEELLAGRFHDHPAKSHRPDGTPFALSGSWGRNHVRFAPYPDSSRRGNNALTDILRCIDGARTEIVFALNKLTREEILAALVRAANRGVEIHGVIPESDAKDTSKEIVRKFGDAGNYRKTNVVRLHKAFSAANGSARDKGEQDLVHCKYMVIDPRGERPVVIHGSANWTSRALEGTQDNDENVVFLRHKGIARAFYAHFNRMTGSRERK